MSPAAALAETDLPGLPCRRGKVRDVYDLGDGRLLLVATDRISAFDWVLPTPIPDKGRVLTGLSAFWFRRLGRTHHLLSTDVDDAGLPLDPETRARLDGRVMIARKAEVIPFECVVRGFLAGSGWREYRERGTLAGEPLPPGLVEGAGIPPRFTPATKAEAGHDENISFGQLRAAVGDDLADALRERSLSIFREASALAEARGLILADTKLEWGRDAATGELILVDEVLTPDSSRFWSPGDARPGGARASFDKQPVRDALDASGWDKASPPPPLAPEAVARTRARYIRAYEMLTGAAFPWT